MKRFSSLIRRILLKRGYRLQSFPDIDIEPEFMQLHEKVKEYTMTSFERQHALYRAVQYVTDHHIQGDIVECGVWKGGSTMLIAETLKSKNDVSRKLYLYDTFAGMSEPTSKDISRTGSAEKKWKKLARADFNEWDYASLDEVKQNLKSTQYPAENISYVKGKVEDTIPQTIPESIALLRLDTDWYESTKHELVHLFPRLVKNGVLIIDDYGHWEGARAAVDEYIREKGITIFLNRIDYTGRLGIKTT
ncbi:MAG: macrocin O-methyltransferase [Parcubacteria group bacterium]|nr:macrocin O-methyltransferase [Parcubacteria group bacterium]